MQTHGGMYYLFNEQRVVGMGAGGGGELFICSLITHLRTIDNGRWEGRKTSEAYSMTFKSAQRYRCTGVAINRATRVARVI